MSQDLSLRFGQWLVELRPRAGGRITRLAYRGQDLLTAPPRAFRVPRRNFGPYETRPVYGYDDCFPTVDPCAYPVGKIKTPDHGELWRLPAKCRASGASLKCVFVSRLWPFVFEREMVFDGHRLVWIFRVVNTGRRPLPFIHVMHPLMPLSRVVRIELPSFDKAVDEVTGKKINLKSGREAGDYLLGIKKWRARMLLLRGVKKGFFRLGFRGGLRLTVNYDCRLFPTLGIWWNNSGYPDERYIAREECAFEPIPGPWSSLARSYREGQFLRAPAGGNISWRMEWRID